MPRSNSKLPRIRVRPNGRQECLDASPHLHAWRRRVRDILERCAECQYSHVHASPATRTAVHEAFSELNRWNLYRWVERDPVARPRIAPLPYVEPGHGTVLQTRFRREVVDILHWKQHKGERLGLFSFRAAAYPEQAGGNLSL
jgi:hypothetical protein